MQGEQGDKASYHVKKRSTDNKTIVDKPYKPIDRIVDL